MLAHAAQKLGCDVAALERGLNPPAGGVVSRLLSGDWDDPDRLRELADLVDVVTLENEFVRVESLEELERSGAALWPDARTLRLIQDKMLQKSFLDRAGCETAQWAEVSSAEELGPIGERFGWPLLLKARRNAYDGKGNATVASLAQSRTAWDGLNRPGGLYVERFCPFVKELAVIVTRGRDGSTAVYPVVETRQRDHVCHTVTAPARIPQASAQLAADLARGVVHALRGVGSFGVEMFLLADGRVLVNEVAPRVHNSGHLTIEACACSQFENHVRAVMGWPLGSPALIAPAAAMVNLLGRRKASGAPLGLSEALAIPGASVHLYGKSASELGRKLGHVTAVGPTPEAALETAMAAAGAIEFGGEP
jgi:5-(carboxyamino)imidazole ribonucleotide synthase